MKVSRRKFLAGSVAGLGALGAGSAGLRFVRKAEAQGRAGEVKYVNSSCAICTSKCVFRGQVVNGIIRRLEPEPDFPKSRGMMCARGNAGAWTPYDPDRVKYPLIRTGRRGEGKWRKATWEEAYKYIADKTNQVVEEEGGHRSCIGFASSEGTYQEMYWHQFREVFGSPNSLRHPTLCLSSVIRGFQSVFGTYPVTDLKNARYVIMAGANRAEAIFTPDTMDIFSRPKGSYKLIYLDPRFTKTAAKADQWLPIKPGTDMAFALALAHVIIAENLYDRDFVANFCTGFDELVEHVKPYSPEWAAEETGIAAADIRQIARELATTPHSVFYPGRRSSWQGEEVQTRRAIAIVNALIGAFDRPGGLLPAVGVPMRSYFYEPAWYTQTRPRLESDDVMFLGPRDGSWVAWRDRALKADPYRIRGLFIYKQNVLEAVPDRDKSMKLFDQMDIIVCIDTFMSDTAWYADVVLPESNYLERLDPPQSLGGIEPTAVFRQPLIDRLYDTKPGFEIVSELAAYFEDEDGFKLSEYFEGSPEEHARNFVADHPGAWEQLREKAFITVPKVQFGAYRQEGRRINTATGKVELYSEDFAGRGLDPLPVFRRCEEPGPDQFRFLVGRHAIHTNSMTAAFPELNWHQPENAVWLNPEPAARLGINDGDLVQMQNRSGAQVTVKAKVTAGIRPDCVYYAPGYGAISPGKPLVYQRGASQAAILESHFEPISGNALMHETIVEIRRV
ncbi:molybdopterin-containing oxidoreductase family protein [Desulfurivibrio alkaliphilus]|uniref:Molybdopterin oxidoreductase n=1 Tax=Desulfurivibrio alkaliphilus (strain DSM 19089 / UNIQEM U267 / AHT2) TaxID=589865 RepID=D6YZW9_DESAT|nr:molybdopterin-dependent oxidoreductase [Desulfurivibrio alkaliphilus]ADH85126.1 molybdopterin oxidoreductase [Desulfurivibrio alkaliphilus AHT 2]